ncbi:MAG: hypothetical protein ACREFE_07300, partial [Limisphaerales bacterium]
VNDVFNRAKGFQKTILPPLSRRAKFQNGFRGGSNLLIKPQLLRSEWFLEKSLLCLKTINFFVPIGWNEIHHNTICFQTNGQIKHFFGCCAINSVVTDVSGLCGVRRHYHGC